jgi:hypothetical protein
MPNFAIAYWLERLATLSSNSGLIFSSYSPLGERPLNPFRKDGRVLADKGPDALLPQELGPGSLLLSFRLQVRFLVRLLVRFLVRLQVRQLRLSKEVLQDNVSQHSLHLSNFCLKYLYNYFHIPMTHIAN